MAQDNRLIGRITRCSTRGFVGALRLPEPDVPTFGTFCLAEAQGGASQVVGLIYDISVEDDEFARQIATTDSATAEQIADGQENRQVPVEFSALAVGFEREGSYHYTIPPQPPLTLAPVHRMSAEAVRGFTSSWDYLPLIVGASQIPADDLLASALRGAARLRPESERRKFLIEAGRACTRLLSDDLVRLDNLLRVLGSTT